jgi:hypothetical protein
MRKARYLAILLTFAAIASNASIASAESTFDDVAAAREFVGLSVNGAGLYFTPEQFTAAGLQVSSVIADTDGTALSSTVIYNAIDGGEFNGQVWISRGDAADPHDFGSGSCGDREIRGPLSLGPFSAYEADCDVSMVYRFLWGGSLYSVGTKYYGGVTRDQLGTIVAGLTGIGSGEILPGALVYLGTTDFEVSPGHITPTGDGSGVLGGRPKHWRPRRGALPDINWKSWTASSARGTGAAWIDNCRPDCASGKFRPYRIVISLTRPIGGHFTRLRVGRAKGSHSRHDGMVGTYRLVDNTDSFSWDVPWF